eukprot:1544078-Prymnesium_polylepis.1
MPPACHPAEHQAAHMPSAEIDVLSDRSVSFDPEWVRRSFLKSAHVENNSCHEELRATPMSCDKTLSFNFAAAEI